MKILHIINGISGGGAESFLISLHSAYLEEGIESYILSLTASGDTSIPYCFCLPCKSPYQLCVFPQLVSYLSQPEWKDLDIIHTQLFPAQLVVPIVSELLGLKARLLTTEQCAYTNRRTSSLYKLLDRFLYSFYSQIVCVSTPTLKSLQEWQPQLFDKLSVIYNAIHFEKFAYTSLPRAITQRCIILSVGRLTKQKNYESAILAMTKLPRDSFEYWIVGTGDLEAEIKSLVKIHQLEENIKFLGFRRDVPDLLGQAHIFLQTSIYEGLSLATIEAMASGLPVIVSDIPEMRELVIDQTGFLVDPHVPEKFVSSIQMLIEDPELRLNIGLKARHRAAQFDIKQIAHQYLTTYQAIGS